MRHIARTLVLVVALAVAGSAFAACPISVVVEKKSTPASHTVKGTVKSLDNSSLVVSHKGGDMTFVVDNSTAKTGSAVGSEVSVKYTLSKRDGHGDTAQPAKQQASASRRVEEDHEVVCWRARCWLSSSPPPSRPGGSRQHRYRGAARPPASRAALRRRGAGAPVIVSSGDGGWIHLGPHVAEILAARGYFVVGFDVKAYLESFTAGHDDAARRGRAGRLPRARRVRRARVAGAADPDRRLRRRRAVGARGDRSRARKRLIAGVIGARPARRQRAGLALAGRAHLPHARRAERADVQRRDARRARGAGAARRDPLHARRVRAAGRGRGRCFDRRAESRSGCGSSTPPTIGSATTCPSSIGALLEAIAWVARADARRSRA